MARRHPRTLPSRWIPTREEAKEEMRDDLNTYTRRGGYRFGSPCIGKTKSSERQRWMLERGSIACHCIGGIAMKDPDLKKLVRKGLMKFTRVTYSSGWGGNYALRRTVAVITPKGQAVLNGL